MPVTYGGATEIFSPKSQKHEEGRNPFLQQRLGLEIIDFEAKALGYPPAKIEAIKARYALVYDKLVEEVGKELKLKGISELKSFDEIKEASFEILRRLWTNIKSQNTEFLAAGLGTGYGHLDCDTSTTLMMDVLSKFGVESSMFILPGHAIMEVKTSDGLRLLETTTQDEIVAYQSKEEVMKKYSFKGWERDIWAHEHELRGNYYLENKKYDEAIADLEEAHRRMPYDPNILEAMSRACSLKNDHESAIKYLTAAIGLSMKDNPNAAGTIHLYRLRAKEHESLSQHDMAVADLKSAIGIEGHDRPGADGLLMEEQSAHFDLAGIYAKQEKFSQAIDEYGQSMISERRTNVRDDFGKADGYVIGQDELGIKLGKEEQDSLNDGKTLFKGFSIIKKKGDALEISSIDPKYAHGLFDRAVCFRNLGKTAEAEMDLAIAAKLVQKQSDLGKVEGWDPLEHFKGQEALDNCNLLLEFTKNTPLQKMLYKKRAGIYESVGEYEKAIGDAKKAMDAPSIQVELAGSAVDKTESIVYIAALYEKAGQLGAALSVIKQALDAAKKEEAASESYPAKTDYHLYNLANLYERNGMLDNAIRSYAERLRLIEARSPKQADYKNQQDYDDAKGFFLEQCAEIRGGLARIYEKKKDYAKMAAECTELITIGKTIDSYWSNGDVRLMTFFDSDLYLKRADAYEQLAKQYEWNDAKKSDEYREKAKEDRQSYIEFR